MESMTRTRSAERTCAVPSAAVVAPQPGHAAPVTYVIPTRTDKRFTDGIDLGFARRTWSSTG